MSQPGEGAAALGDVSRETLARLELFQELLKKWSRSINLVSAASLETVWQRHILDSAQVWAARQFEAGLWVDLGSGGGFPGAVVALLAADTAPELRVACVESDQRKAAFLRTVSRETGVRFDVIDARIEAVDPLGAQVVSARALAPLTRLLGYAVRHLAPGGQALFLKGEQHDNERLEAEKNWRFTWHAIRSETDPQAVLFSIGDIVRV